MRFVIIAMLAAGMAAAAPLEVGSWQGGQPWRVPGGGEAVRLEPGQAATLSVTVTVPELCAKWMAALEIARAN